MDNSRKTIVVFGCTGTVGKHVLEQLTKHNCSVRGVLRNPQRSYPVVLKENTNLSYVSADLSNYTEVDNACKYADTIFLLTATNPKQVDYETNVITAAKKNGIKRIIKLSAPDIESSNLVEVGNWHRQIEDVLANSGIEYCCLRPYAFMQNWERNTFTVRKFGKIYGIMKDAVRNYVDARDVAEIAVNLLLQDNALEQQYLSITGPEAISNFEMADRISKVTGREITYINISKDALFKNLTKRAKLPLWLANHIIELEELALKIEEPGTDSTENLLNKKPRLMDEYLQEYKELFSKEPIWKVWR